MTDDVKKKSAEVWGATPAGSEYVEGCEPGTKEFFDGARAKRCAYELPWLPSAAHFDDAAGKTVLELGCGAGFDAFEFCSRGAQYFGIDITPQNPTRTLRHLSFYDFTPQVAVADAESLPFRDESFDAAYSFGVLHHTPDMPASFRETFRTLKKGGSFFVAVYHRNSVYHWLSLYLFQYVLRGGFLKESFRNRLARIELTTSGELPLVNVYSRSELKKILEDAGFRVESVSAAKLLHVDLPDIPLVNRLYKRIPQSILDAVGKRFGWYVMARAVKE